MAVNVKVKPVAPPTKVGRCCLAVLLRVRLRATFYWEVSLNVQTFFKNLIMYLPIWFKRICFQEFSEFL